MNIALRGNFLAGKLLGRHVLQRTLPRFGLRDLSRHGSETEIHHDHFAPAVNHHVCRLEIAVQDPTLVGGRQPLAQSSGDVDPLVRRDTPDASQKRGEILSIHVLHGQERLATGRADVVYAAHVRVRYLPGGCLARSDTEGVARFRMVGVVVGSPTRVTVHQTPPHSRSVSWWVSVRRRLKNWKMKPILSRRKRVRSSSERSATDWPSMRIWPEVGRSSPPIRLRSVDFPEPDGPTRETISPRAMCRSMASSAATWRLPL